MTMALMFDCESLDTAPTAALLSVGIVEMNMDTLTLGQEFHLRIDPDDCMEHGMTVSAETIRWWASQNHEYFAKAFLRGDYGLDSDKNYWNPIALAAPKINTLVQFFGKVDVWACGTRDFDWLETLYRKAGTPVPWAYSAIRDYRTLRETFPMVTRPPDNPQPHDALADARWQAEHLLAIMRYIRKMVVAPEEGDL